MDKIDRIRLRSGNQLLTPEQYEVLRQEGTERPNSSSLNQEKRKGTFVCAGCGQPLFKSETKFDSRTGWPSFLRASRARWRPRTTGSSWCRGPSTIARAAAAIRVTYSTTDRRRRASAFATTASHCASSPNDGRDLGDSAMDVTYRPIGIVRSPFTAVEGMPIQPSRAQEVEGSLEIDPEFHAGLKDLDGFSHILLVCHLHRVSGFELTVVPFLDTERRGIFATRAPKRPNPIAVSVLRVKGVIADRCECSTWTCSTAHRSST